MSYSIDWEKISLEDAQEIATDLSKNFFLKGFVHDGMSDYKIADIVDIKVEDSVKNLINKSRDFEEKVL